MKAGVKQLGILALCVSGFSVLTRADPVTYAENIRPLLQSSCLNCHNADKHKAGLDLSTYEATMEGSDGGKVVLPGDAGKSLLFRVVTHAEEPSMPQKADKLADSQLDLIRQWIDSGAADKAGGMIAKKAGTDLAPVAVDETPKGPPPMPRDLLLEPVLRAHRAGAIAAMAASRWAPLVAVAGQKQVLLFNTDTLELAAILPFPEGFPDVLKFSRDGQLLLAGGGIGAKLGRVVVWDVTTGARVAEVGDEFDAVLAADISADRAFIALGGPNKLVKIFSARDGSLLHKMKKHTDWVTALAFTPDGKSLVTGDRAGGLVVWDLEGREQQSISAHKGAITSVAAFANIVATASEDGTVKFWDVREGKETKSWEAHKEGVTALAFAADGRVVTCGRDRVTRLWEAGGKKLREFEPFEDVALAAAFAGEKVIAGDWTGTLRMWSAQGQRVAVLDANPPTLAERVEAVVKRLGELEPALALAQKQRADAENSVTKISTEMRVASEAAQAKEAAVKTAETRVAELRRAADEAAKASQKTHEELAQLERDLPMLANNATASTAGSEAALREQKEIETGMQKKQEAAAQLAEAASAAEKTAAQLPSEKVPAEKAAEARAAAEKAVEDLVSSQKLSASKTEELQRLTEAATKAVQVLAEHQTTLNAARETLSQRAETETGARLAFKSADSELAKHRDEASVLQKALPPMTDHAKAAEAALSKAREGEKEAVKKLADAKVESAKWRAAQVNVSLHAAREAQSGLAAERQRAVDAQAQSADSELTRAAAEKGIEALARKIQDAEKEVAQLTERFQALRREAEPALTVASQK